MTLFTLSLRNRWVTSRKRSISNPVSFYFTPWCCATPIRGDNLKSRRAEGRDRGGGRNFIFTDPYHPAWRDLLSYIRLLSSRVPRTVISRKGARRNCASSVGNGAGVREVFLSFCVTLSFFPFFFLPVATRNPQERASGVSPSLSFSLSLSLPLAPSGVSSAKQLIEPSL